MRTCAKLRCDSAAAATVSCRYGAREVVIEELGAGRDPNLLDLCAQHAERLTPPMGWRVRDRRTRVPAPSA